MRVECWMVWLAGMCLAGCTPHVVVEQAKPFDINITVSGHFDVVIQDARENLEQISGEKPAHVVNPADIGLPATATGPGAMGPGAKAPVEDESWGETYPVIWAVPRGGGHPVLMPVATVNELKQSLKVRHAKVQGLWEEKRVGEAHTGLLVARGELNAEQAELVKAENSDRTELYAAEAKSKGISTEEVVLSYYLARLGYAKKGAWYEKMNSSTKQWEWKQWGE